jgi:hypothetical protein
MAGTTKWKTKSVGQKAWPYDTPCRNESQEDCLTDFFGLHGSNLKNTHGWLPSTATGVQARVIRTAMIYPSIDCWASLWENSSRLSHTLIGL